MPGKLSVSQMILTSSPNKSDDFILQNIYSVLEKMNSRDHSH
jgi:hypothetical protein